MAAHNVVDLRSLVARLHESFNDRDLDAWSALFDEDVELVVDGAAFRGVDAARAYVTAVFREFPGLRIHGARIVAECGDTIVVSTRSSTAIPPSGRYARRARCARSTACATAASSPTGATTRPSGRTARTS